AVCFFQAEDGIRDRNVTGVQTCALPISAYVFETTITEEAATEVARRARGTPRIANRLLKRIRDISQVKGESEISFETTRQALDMLQVDDAGLDHIDHKLLKGIID